MKARAGCSPSAQTTVANDNTVGQASVAKRNQTIHKWRCRCNIADCQYLAKALKVENKTSVILMSIHPYVCPVLRGCL